MLTVTHVQSQMLEALARYKFLTHSQLEALKIASLAFLRKTTKHLREYPSEKQALLAVIRFPFNPQYGRIEHVFYLTESGALVLADILGVDVSELDYQKVTSVYHQDYLHRKYTVDFHIWLSQELANNQHIELARFDRYFDKTGANRTNDISRGALRAVTRVDFANDKGYIIPDVNFILQGKKDPSKQALFCLEMTNGKDTKRILAQIYKHSLAMQDGSLARAYGITRSNYVCLFLFSEHGLMEAVRERFHEAREIKAFEHLFYFGDLNNAKWDVLRCWQKAKALGDEKYNFITGKYK